MVRQTPNHGWDVPESSDEWYSEIVDDLFDDIDQSVILKGPIGERPAAGREGRLYLSTDETPIKLYYDDVDFWKPIKGSLELPDNVTQSDASETISAKWSFLEKIQGSIDGSAGHASTAGLAEDAHDADRLGDRPAEEYVRENVDERIDDDWNFQSTVTLEAGIQVDEGTIDLPTYDNSDPANTQPGAMWFRLDHQPTN